MLDNIVCNFCRRRCYQTGRQYRADSQYGQGVLIQPEIMTFLRNTLLMSENDVKTGRHFSPQSMIAQMNDPAVRRGLALTLRVLHVVGAQGPRKKSTKKDRSLASKVFMTFQ